MELRPHHLICLNFFRGYGYSDEFTKRLREIVEGLNSEEILVVFGGDDICVVCPYFDKICEKEPEVTEIDYLASKLLEINFGDIIMFSEIERKIPEIIGIWRKYACDGCEWENVCFSVQER